jgi:preprotein translocase subunit SecY
LVVTVMLPAIAWAAQGLRLPGIEGWKLDFLVKSASTTPDLSNLSVVALGLSPAISAFVLVELVALLNPRWRSLRRGTPEQRRSLRSAAVLVTVLFAAIQGWFVATWLHQQMPLLPGGTLMDDPGLGSRVLMALTLVGGACFMLALAWLLDAHGLGNGFSILLSAAAIPAAFRLASMLVQRANLGVLAPGDILTLLVELAVMVLATRWILTWHRKPQPEKSAAPLVALRNPTSGIVPLVTAASLLELPAQLANLGVPFAAALRPTPGTTSYAVAQVVLMALLCVLFSLAFNQDRRMASARTIRAGILRATLFLVGVGVVFPALISKLRLHLVVDEVLLVTATAVALDLVAEWRARTQHGALVAIWPLHQVALVGAATDALSRAGIFVHPRGACHRSLLHFFGPYIPIDLLVPETQAPDARQILERVLLEPAAGHAERGTVPAQVPPTAQ